MSINPLPYDNFIEEQSDVLSSWPTGKDVSFKEGVHGQAAIPETKRFSIAMENAKKKKKTLIQPRAGVALVDDHIMLLNYLEKEGEADLLPTTIDAYTRQNRYAEAQNGIARSQSAGTSLLNGFPAVNHGVAECRRVTESVTKPVQVRHGTPDARLLAEITLAAGFTSFEGGGISYNIPYTKKVPLEKSIRDWQYVDRLCGLYENEGISINREPFGPLTGTIVPPCLSHAVAIIEGILALEQGVKSITLGYGQGGCIAQDTAALRSLRTIAEKWFTQEGFSDFSLTIVFHQWMGGFPPDEARAFSVISLGSIVAAMSGAEKVIVKTPHEAMGIPTREANAQGLRNTRQILKIMEDQPINFQNEASIKEEQIITEEVNQLLHAVRSVHEKEKKNWATAAAKAFSSGIIDIPFAPSVYNNGKCMPMRDNNGFIRIFQPGAVALSENILSYHREKLEERARAEGRSVSFQMITDDIYAISKGKLIGRPR